MPNEILITADERKWIESLQRLARRAPKSLSLFGNSGTLHVTKMGQDGRLCDIESIEGVDCDGGDWTDEVVDQYAEIDYDVNSPGLKRYLDNFDK